MADPHRRDPVGDKPGEGAGGVAKINVIGVRLRNAAARIQKDQLIRPLHRQRTQKKLIERAESGCIGPDSQRQRSYGDDRKSGRSAQTP
jgi:hypothetical protein